jgi:hypothetical protein
MIFRRYGTSYQSVDLNFDSKALNEVAFRRDHEQSIPTDELEAGYEQVAAHELVAEAEGDVQDHTEQALLDDLASQLRAVEAGLGAAELLVVENEQGNDWPKTKQRTTNVIVEGENRLRFHYVVGPALRVTVRRKKA